MRIETAMDILWLDYLGSELGIGLAPTDEFTTNAIHIPHIIHISYILT